MKFYFPVFISAFLVSQQALADDIPAIDCMIEPNAMVELSSSVAGVVDTLAVDRSDKVKKGEVIATLKADVEEVGVKTSKERLKLIEAEHKRALELYRDKAITLSEKDKSDNEKKLSELELQQAKANLNMRLIKSPINGVVVKRYFNPGEFVDNRPIVKLAQLDPLRIEVVSPISNYGKIIKGMKARITPEFGSYQGLIAEVVIVDKVIDAASGTFGIRLELENKNHAIPGGLKCRAQFLPEKTEQTDHEANIDHDHTVDVTTPDVTTPVDDATLPDKGVPEIEETPAKVADSTDTLLIESASDEGLMCTSIGPYKQQAMLKKTLSGLDINIQKQNLRTETETKTTYNVRSRAFNAYSEVKEQMRIMKAAGLTDIAMFNNQGKYYITLGYYRNKSLAEERLNILQAQGYDLYIKTLESAVDTYWADLVYPAGLSDVLNSVIPEANRIACTQSAQQDLAKK